MRALKSQHMTLFSAKTREQIWEQWDALFMSEAERHTLFPAYFLELPDAESDTTFDYDAILAQHEQMCARLGEMLEQRAPLLALIGRYQEICNEARALEESAQDGSRLLGRNNRGDPGRLLREEKMRKRVKIQKPKVEHELLRVIPAWEAEHDMPFLMDGVRFVDYLQEQLDSAKENNKQPARMRPAEHAAHAAPTAGAPGTKRPASRPLSRAAGAPARPISRAAGAGAAARPRTAAATPGARARVVDTPHTQGRSAPTMRGTPRDTPRTPSRLLSSSLAHAPGGAW